VDGRTGDLTHLEDEAGIDNKPPKEMFKMQPNKEDR
jgi:hypothetical protein